MSAIFLKLREILHTASPYLLIPVIVFIASFGKLQAEVQESLELSRGAVPRSEFSLILKRLDDIQTDIRDLRQVFKKP